jgi:glycerol-3-phosphate acyltransferase PlsY
MLLAMVCFAIGIVDFLRLHVNGIKEAFILFFGSFLRRHEIRRLSGASYLLLGCFITSLLYGKPIVVAACSYIIVGDTFAAIFGQNIKSPRIFQNKTVLGTAAFLIASLISAYLLHILTGALPLWHLFIGAVAASVFESLPLPLDDNFSVPIITGFIMSLL